MLMSRGDDVAFILLTIDHCFSFAHCVRSTSTPLHRAPPTTAAARGGWTSCPPSHPKWAKPRRPCSECIVKLRCKFGWGCAHRGVTSTCSGVDCPSTHACLAAAGPA